MAPQDHDVPPNDTIGRGCCLVVPLLFGALSLWFGQDANWDLRNYHWYNPYALRAGRFAVDLAAAQTSTFYNPLLDVPFYLLADILPARVTGFMLGVLHGTNFILLYQIAKCLRLPWRAAVAAIGVLGGGHLGLVGTSFQDNVASLFVLGGLLLLMRGAASSSLRGAVGAITGAAVLIGAVVGLKLPTAIYGVGLAAACLALPWRWSDRVAALGLFGVASGAGLLATNGFWMARLWTAFGNPIYPYFNDVIGSNMALSESYRDQRFIPAGLGDVLAFPFFPGLKPLAVGEIAFADFRIAVLYIVLAAALALAATRFRFALPPGLRVALVMTIVSYAAWLGVFAIYRYIIATEMLAPLLAAALVMQTPLTQRVKAMIMAAAGAFLVVTTSPGTWGRVPWRADFVRSEPPPIEASAMILMAGTAPTAWVAPSFPPDASFIRLSGYSHHPRDGDVGLVKVARERVQAHIGAFYLVHAAAEEAEARDVTGRYGLEVDDASCGPLPGNLDPHLRICAVHRKVAAP